MTLPKMGSSQGHSATRSGPDPGRWPRIAVIVPCHQEEATIAAVTTDFRCALPMAKVYVFDNASTDRTAEVARAAGAIVRSEPMKGKGNVVRRMFADVEADVYIMVDGDGTYDAMSAPGMVQLLLDERLDMVVGIRVSSGTAAYRAGHRFGNRLLTGCVAWIFGNRFTDMLSGYRVVSRRFAKSFPALAGGFETETELTVHALTLGVPIAEVPTPYGARPEGSASKLSTYKDGLRILITIVSLFKTERPLVFYGACGAILALTSIALAVPLIITFLETRLVPRIPTAILATGMMLLAFLSTACGLILDTVTHGRREQSRLAYLSYAAISYNDPE